MTKKQEFQEQLTATNAAGKVALLIGLLQEQGHHHFEEEVTQYAHAVQSAYWATQHGKDSQLITAALLHDIGHLLHDETYEEGTYNESNHYHEDIAADLLQAFFPERVVAPIQMHVLAKRYLVTHEEGYYDLLSPTSQESFHLQGGHMTPSESIDFESRPYFLEALLVRRWDDLAKSLDIEVPSAESYRDDLLAALAEISPVR